MPRRRKTPKPSVNEQKMTAEQARESLEKELAHASRVHDEQKAQRHRTFARDHAAEYRRELVAKWRLRGLTYREISRMIYEVDGLTNPKTGKPYSYVTIKKDLDDLTDEWRGNARGYIEDSRALLLAELENLKRVGWQVMDLDLVRGIIKDIRDMLGADAPRRSISVIENHVEVEFILPEFVEVLTDAGVDPVAAMRALMAEVKTQIPDDGKPAQIPAKVRS